VRFGTDPQIKDAAVKTIKPMISMGLRPKRSASAQAGISSEAKLNIYAAIVHSIPARVAFNDQAIDGRDT